MNNALKKVLFAREAPYVATLFVAFAAWILTHLAERLVQTPTLDYEAMRQELSPQEKADARIFPPTNSSVAAEQVQKDVFRVTNISHTARFGKITFYLKFPPDSSRHEKMRFAWTTYNLPALPRTKAVGDKKSEPAGCDHDGWAWYSIGGIGQRMLVKARAAEAAGKPAEAALALKELVQYTASSDPALASLFQKRILDLGGDIFNVQTPAQPHGNETKWAATPRLKQRVRDFQKVFGLSVNGTLDKPTLTKAAERENYTARTTTTIHSY